MRCIPSKEDMQRALEARHGKDLQQKFTNSTVAICGLGGLGSNIAVSLARAGIGVLEKLHTKYLIAASGMAGLGSANSIQTRRITNRFYLCGDGISDVADNIGLVAPRVMLCAAHQAHMVLRILSGNLEP